jgi:hypothetical protein
VTEARDDRSAGDILCDTIRQRLARATTPPPHHQSHKSTLSTSLHLHISLICFSIVLLPLSPAPNDVREKKCVLLRNNQKPNSKIERAPNHINTDQQRKSSMSHQHTQ